MQQNTDSCFPFFNSLYLGFGMCWARLEEVGWVLEHMVAVQILVPSLERGFCRSSEPCVLCLFARASGLVLEHAFVSLLDLMVVILGSSELSFARASELYVLSFFAQASTLALERASGLQTWSFALFARATVLALERGIFVSGRSSDQSFARASLEYISCSSASLLYFFISFYFQTLDPTLSLSIYTPSLYTYPWFLGVSTLISL